VAATRRISANAIAALKDALTAAFWFKRDLYNYAKAAVGGDPTFLAGIDWTSPDQYKRDSVNLFVDRLVREQDDHQDLLLALLVDVAAMTEFADLQRAEDPTPKIAAAREAVARLRAVVQPYERALMEQQASRERFDAAKVAAEERRATSQRLAELKARYLDVMAMSAQSRGYELEKLLADVFDAFDLDPRASFRVVGEQIDGGLTFGGEYFLLEAKWQQSATARDELDVFSAKVRRRGENTLGLFISINGFEPTAVEIHSGNRSPIVLMDGADLYAVLDERIDLRELLGRKRRETSMSGRVLLTAADILGEA
jgi:Restriction endonuclease